MTLPKHFLAFSRLPSPLSEAEMRARLERVAEAAHARGIRPVESFYSLDRGVCYTLYEAGSEAEVRAAHADARIDTVDVVPGERVFTELLDRTHRTR